MSESGVVHSTFVIERTYPRSVESVFAAFADPATRRRWFAEGDGHEVEEYASEFRVGGLERLRYRFKEGTPFTGVVISNEGSYQDIVPAGRIVTSSRMSFGDKSISVSLVTIEFIPTAEGTNLICTHQGTFFEGSDGPQIREAGWRKVLERLAARLQQGE